MSTPSDEGDAERRLSEDLERIDRIEALIRHGTRALRDQISAVCTRLTKPFDDGEPERGLVVVDDTGGWTIFFRQHQEFVFEIQPGLVASAKHVLARGTVRRADADEALIVLHLVNTNDHADWEIFDSQKGTTRTFTDADVVQLIASLIKDK